MSKILENLVNHNVWYNLFLYLFEYVFFLVLRSGDNLLVQSFFGQRPLVVVVYKKVHSCLCHFSRRCSRKIGSVLVCSHQSWKIHCTVVALYFFINHKKGLCTVKALYFDESKWDWFSHESTGFFKLPCFHVKSTHIYIFLKNCERLSKKTENLTSRLTVFAIFTLIWRRG